MQQLDWRVPELDTLSSGDNIVLGEEILLLHTIQQMGRLTIASDGTTNLSAGEIVDLFDTKFQLRIKQSYIDDLFVQLENDCLEYSVYLGVPCHMGDEVPRVNFNMLSSEQESYDPRCYDRQTPSPFQANPRGFYSTWANTLERRKGNRHIKLTGAWVPKNSMFFEHRVTQFQTNDGTWLGFVQRKDAMGLLQF